MKRLFRLFMALALALLLPVCALGVEADGLFSDKDRTEADPAKAVELALSEDGVDITQAGVYRLSGQVANGSIRVSLNTEGTVWLLLDGVSVHNEKGAALTSTGCKKLILTLAEGSVNALTQGEGTPDGEDNDAAIYVRDDLTINGSGALTVESAYLDGINCRDSLRIVDGQITVNAVDDGIVGKDEVSIGGGVIAVTAKEGDGIKSTNSEDAERGFVAIAGGSVSITTGDGSASQTADAWSLMARPSADTRSQKGIKAETHIDISGGSLTVDSVDDALHSVNVTLSGGTLTLATGDDGVHADHTLSISGGQLAVTNSYEGLEAANIFISGGEISIIASDDGVNGAGGDSVAATEDGGWGAMGRFGRDMFSSSTGTLSITGGRIFVTASGDGVDVNGDLSMSGGELYVRGPENSGNSALDYDGSFTLTGGTLAAVGTAGMAQGVNAPSIPGAALSLSGSGALEVLDASNAVVVSFDAQGGYNHVVVYSDRFSDGGDYTLVTGGTSQAVQMSVQASEGGPGKDGRGGFNGGRGGFDGGPDGFDGSPDGFDGAPDGFDGDPDGFDGDPDGFDGGPDGFDGGRGGFDGGRGGGRR